MLGVTGICSQKLAGDFRAFSAMNKAFILATNSYRAFAVKRMSVCLYTSAAVAAVLPFTAGAVKSASRIGFCYVVLIVIWHTVYSFFAMNGVLPIFAAHAVRALLFAGDYNTNFCILQQKSAICWYKKITNIHITVLDKQYGVCYNNKTNRRHLFRMFIRED